METLTFPLGAYRMADPEYLADIAQYDLGRARFTEGESCAIIEFPPAARAEVVQLLQMLIRHYQQQLVQAGREAEAEVLDAHSVFA